VIILALALLGGWATGNPAQIAHGKAVYEVACAQCHGKDGAGNPEWESEVRPVSFKDCGTTAEPTALWLSIVSNGGARHGLADVMPAFGEAFPREDLAAVVAYVRTFCETADRYPPGDLNFRRTLGTEKAFPEAEVVIQSKVVRSRRATEMEVIYENRIGARFQYEFEFPFRPSTTARKYGPGIGDIGVGAKYVLHFDRDAGRIVSAAMSASFPTGNEGKDLGVGTTLFTPSLLLGQRIGGSVIQARLGFELPADTQRSDRNWQYAFAYQTPPIGAYRTGFVGALEIVGAYNPRNGNHEQVVVLGASKALSRLGHVVASVGVGIPLRPSGAPHPRQIRAFLIWDFGDGPFWRGW
jgi:mono/diheme cytochrome c family protein